MQRSVAVSMHRATHRMCSRTIIMSAEKDRNKCYIVKSLCELGDWVYVHKISCLEAHGTSETRSPCLIGPEERILIEVLVLLTSETNTS